MQAPLTADNLDVSIGPQGIILDLQVFRYMRGCGYPVNGIEELNSVARNDSDTGHIVAKIETTKYPKDHPDLDVVEHQTTMWVCDCWDYLSEQYPDLREADTFPSDGSHCTHIERVRE